MPSGSIPIEQAQSGHVRSRRTRGFSLVELLVVVLVLAILMAIALPMYIETVADSATKACRANQHSIANSAQAWKVRNRYRDFTLLNFYEDLAPDLGPIMKCPDNGIYDQVQEGQTTQDSAGRDLTVPIGGFGVECSIERHGGFVPGIQKD